MNYKNFEIKFLPVALFSILYLSLVLFIDSYNPFFTIKETILFSGISLLIPFIFSNKIKGRISYIIIFILYGIIPFISPISQFTSFYKLLLNFYKILFLISLIAIFKIDERYKRYSIQGLTLVVFFSSIYGILQYYGFNYPDWKLKQGPVAHFSRTIFSFFGNPNFLSAFLVLTFFPIISNFKKYKKRGKIFLVISALLSIFTIIISYTRASWVIISIGSLYYTTLTLKIDERGIFNRYVKNIFFFSLLILIIIFSTKNSLNKGDTLSYNNRTIIERITNPTGSFNKRILAWRSTINGFTTSPFRGHGVGSFSRDYLKLQMNFLKDKGNEKYNVYWDNFEHAHNDYIEDLYDFGILGFLISIIFYIFIFWISLREVFVEKDYNYAAFHVTIFSYLLYRLISFPDFIPSSYIVFFIATAFTFSNRFTFKFEENLKVKIVKFILITPLAAYLFLLPIYPLISDIKIMRASDMLRIDNLDMADELLNDALKYNKRGISYFLLAASALRRHRYTNALLEYSKALDYSYDPAIFHNMGIIYLSKGDPVMARKFFKKAIEIFPYNFEVMLPLSKIYMESGLVNKGVKLLKLISKWYGIVKKNGSFYNKELPQYAKEAEKIFIGYLLSKHIELGEVFKKDGRIFLRTPSLVAKNISLIGEFNKYNPETHIMKESSDIPGLWEIELKNIPRGVYEYYYLINGSTKIIDPFAEKVEFDNGEKASILRIK